MELQENSNYFVIAFYVVLTMCITLIASFTNDVVYWCMWWLTVVVVVSNKTSLNWTYWCFYLFHTLALRK